MPDSKNRTGSPYTPPQIDDLAASGNIPFARSPSGLWLMEDGELSHTQSPEPHSPLFDFSVRTVGWQALTGRAATIDDVASRIQRLSVRQVTSLVARITFFLNERRRDDNKSWGKQRRIAEGLIGPKLSDRLLAAATAAQEPEIDLERLALFHERQTLNALKLAFLLIDVDAPEPATPDQSAFCEALIMLNDIIDPPEGTMGPTTPGGIDAMELYITANILFNSSPDLMAEFVRAHYLYVEAHPEIRGKGLVDVPAMLERATGMPAETVWRALFALFASWASRSSEEVGAGNVATSRESYFSTMPGLVPEEREQWFGLATWEAEKLQEAIRDSYSQSDLKYWDVLPFEKKPLIAFADLVFCPSIPLFQRLAGPSLQHRVQDPEIFSATETRRLRDTRGHLVEEYTIASLRRAFNNRVIPETELQQRASGKSVCDAIIVYADAVILIECKTASPLLDTRHARNYAAFRSQWRDRTVKAATQLYGTISLARQGVFSDLGLDSPSYQFFPVIAVFEQPIQPLTYRSMMSDLDGHPLLDAISAGESNPLQFISINEIEMWETAAEQGRSIKHLLFEKTRAPNTTELSLNQFLYYKGETFQTTHSEWQKERFTQITESAKAYYRELGLSGDRDDEDSVER